MPVYIDDDEFDIVRCCMVDNKINILFSGNEEDEYSEYSYVEGKILGIEPHSKMQSIKMDFTYPTSKKEIPHISKRSEEEIDESFYDLTIKGKLTNFRGKEVIFEGEIEWPDGTFDEGEDHMSVITIETILK